MSKKRIGFKGVDYFQEFVEIGFKIFQRYLILECFCFLYEGGGERKCGRVELFV